MDKLVQVMEVMRAAFDADPMLEGPWWLWHDDDAGGLCPRFERFETAQLAHDVVGSKGRVYVATDVDAVGSGGGLRGIVLQRVSYGVVWQVDDGRGLVERGSARRLIDAIDGLWRTAVFMLANPARVAHAVLKKAVDGREGLKAMGRVSLRPGRVVWGDFEARFGGEETPWPTIVLQDFTEVVARELVSCGLLAHQAVGVLLHMGKPHIEGHTAPARPFHNADRDILQWREEWCPGDPPAAMRDAASSAKRSDVDGRWRHRLQAHIDQETAKARKRRLKVVEARLQAEVHLPPVGADPTGKEAAGYYGATGADRLPIPSDVVAALWVLGFGGRMVSEFIVGSRSSKSAMSRRIKELQDGRDDLQPVKGAVVLQRLELSPGEQRPDSAPGAKAGRADGAVKVTRRGQPPFDVYVDQLDDKTAAFVYNLPERALRFISALYQRREMTSAELLEVLDLSMPKALGGVTGSICRWAPVRGIKIPYERMKHDDKTISYRWRGFQASSDSSQDAA